MGGTLPTHGELIGLTRRQAAMIESLGAKVDASRMSRRRPGERAYGKPPPSPEYRPRPPQVTRAEDPTPAEPPAHHTAPVGRSHDRGPVGSGVPGVPSAVGRGPGRRARPVPDRPARTPAGHHPLPHPGGPPDGLLPLRPRMTRRGYPMPWGPLPSRSARACSGSSPN
jgi:hypothetical protein